MNEWCAKCKTDTLPRKLKGVNRCYFCDGKTSAPNYEVDTNNYELMVPDYIEGGLDYTMNMVFAATTLMHSGEVNVI